MDIEVDLVEIVEAGIEALYPDKRERFAALHEAAEQLQHNAPAAIGQIIARRMQTVFRAEVIAASLCPECGAEIIEEHRQEAHPYGNTVAVERTVHLVCPQCGEL